MSKFQSLLAILFTLCVPAVALTGQIEFATLILAMAVMASVTTVLYGLAKEQRQKQVSKYEFD